MFNNNEIKYRDPKRFRLASDVEAFLAAGGTITEVPIYMRKEHKKGPKPINVRAPKHV